jgi:hypothetical protein
VTGTQAGATPGGEGEGGAGWWMRQVADGLTAAGLEARVHDTQGVLDVTATLQRPAGKASEVIVDEDGYTEIRYWSRPGASPAHVTTVIVRALAAIAVAQRS